jgi:hypothetical protein
MTIRATDRKLCNNKHGVSTNQNLHKYVMFFNRQIHMRRLAYCVHVHQSIHVHQKRKQSTILWKLENTVTLKR